MKRLFVLLAIASLAVACGGPSEEKTFLENAEQTATDTAALPGSPGGTAVVPDVSTGTTVLVSLQDGRVLVQDFDKIPPGPAVFTVTNAGPDVHTLAVEGPNVSRTADEASMATGAQTSFEVNLTPGSYTLYCPLGDHRQRGESATLTIRPAGAPAPTSTVVPDTPTGTTTAPNAATGTTTT